MKIDNNQDGMEDITFQFRFTTEIRQPGLFTGFVGGIAGIPPITSLGWSWFRRPELTPDLYRDHGQERVSTDLTRRKDVVCGAFERRSADHAQLPCAVQPGNL